MNRIRALTLALLALCGLTAFMAAGAQGNWLVEKKENEVTRNVLAKAHTTPLELDLLGTLKVEIRCSTLKNQANLKILAKSEKAEGKVEFTGCGLWTKTDLLGDEAFKCKPVEPIVAGGSALIASLAKTSGGALKNYILFAPESGKPFTTISFPESCSLVQTSNVTGSLVAECGFTKTEPPPTVLFEQEDCGAVERKEHLLRQGPTVWFNGSGDTTKVTDELKFGAVPADLLGIAAVELETKELWCGHI